MKSFSSPQLRRWLHTLGIAWCTAMVIVLVEGQNPWAIAASPLTSLGQSQASQVLSQSGNALLQQGRNYYTTEQFYEAVTVWSEAETQFARQGDGLNQATVLSNLALAHRQLSQWSEAEAAIAKGLALLDQLQPPTQQSLRIYGQILNTQGSLYLAQGKAEPALEAWEQATEIYTQADYPKGVVKSLINQTYALRSLGFSRESHSRLSHVKALLKEQADASLKVVLTRSLGDSHRLMGELKASKAWLDESLRLAKTLPSAAELPATQLSLGNTLQVRAQQQETFASRTGKKEDLAQADLLYRQALDTYAAISDSAPLLLQVRAQLNQLDIVIRRQDWGAADSLHRSLLTHLEALPIGRASTFAHMRLARLLMDACAIDCLAEIQSSQQDIYTLLATAKQQAESIKDPIAESYALGYLGYFYETQARYADAQRFTEAALKQARNQPSLIYQWEWQLGRLENNLLRSRESVLQHYDIAFQNVQTVRSDLLYVGPEVQFDFRDRIEPLYREYIGLLLPKNNTTVQDDPTQLLRAQTVIDDLRVAELESFLACGLIEPNDNIPRTSIQQVANTDKTTAIIYPIILPDGPGTERLEVLIQLPNQTIRRYSSQRIVTDMSKAVDAPVSAIERKLKRFRQDLERPSFIFSKRGRLQAEEIYDWLIRPAETEGWLESMDTLVFVLDGAFRNVPMAALRDRQTEQFLVEKYAIAVTFGDLEIPQTPPEESLSVLAAGLSFPSVLPVSPNSPIASRAIGDDPAIPFVPLPYVETELESIQATIDDTEYLLNLEFNKKSFQSKMRSSEYNVVHLATHGVFGFTRDETFLLASAPEAAIEANQNLGAQLDQPIKVEKIDLNDLGSLLKTRNQTPLELLALSACETATGDSRELLGIAGLAVQSGARSTLATLWRINDFSTSVLMKDFYEQLVTQGVSKAKALQHAQIKLLRESRHPSQWAPYLLVGDWR